MKHTMSMYQTKDAMLEAMQTEIDSLKAQLAEARKDSERLDWIILKGGDIGISENIDYSDMQNYVYFTLDRLYWIDGFDEIARGVTPREAIDNAMNRVE